MDTDMETDREWTEMRPQHAAFVDDFIETAQRSKAMASDRLRWAGGMQWKRVKCHEYLVRYYDVGGERQTISHGRRSPETEAMMSEFETGRANWRSRMLQLREAMDEQGRMAKALRLGRVSPLVSSALIDLQRSDAFDALDRHKTVLAVTGCVAMHAYEIDRKVLFAHDLVIAARPTLELATVGNIWPAVDLLELAFPDARRDDDGVLTRDGLRICVLPTSNDLVVAPMAIFARDGTAIWAPVIAPVMMVKIEAARGTDISRRRARAVAAVYDLEPSVEADAERRPRM